MSSIQIWCELIQAIKAVIAITVTVIIAQCSRVTSMITPANRNAAVIIVNRRRDHEFVIIAPVLQLLYPEHFCINYLPICILFNNKIFISSCIYLFIVCHVSHDSYH